jgi:hypothetical protein
MGAPAGGLGWAWEEGGTEAGRGEAAALAPSPVHARTHWPDQEPAVLCCAELGLCSHILRSMVGFSSKYLVMSPVTLSPGNLDSTLSRATAQQQGGAGEAVCVWVVGGLMGGGRSCTGAASGGVSGLTAGD